MLKIVSVIVIFLLAVTSNASELQDRKLINQQVRTGFYGKNFEHLEKIAEDFRVSESRTPSGLWKLTLFYNSIEQMTNWISMDGQWDVVENINQKWLERYPHSPTPHITQASFYSNAAGFIVAKGMLIP